jgi:hypothetical protein
MYSKRWWAESYDETETGDSCSSIAELVFAESQDGWIESIIKKKKEAYDEKERLIKLYKNIVKECDYVDDNIKSKYCFTLPFAFFNAHATLSNANFFQCSIGGIPSFSRYSVIKSFAPCLDFGDLFLWSTRRAKPTTWKGSTRFLLALTET